MHPRRFLLSAVLLPALLLAVATQASATMQLERNIIHFLPGQPPRIDLQVTNPDGETLYVEVEVLEVLNAGTDAETRMPVRDPRSVDFLVTPNKFIVAPGSRKVVRFVNTGGHGDTERIFRVNLKPVSPPAVATQTAIRVVVGYQVLAMIAPGKPKAELLVDRTGNQLTVRNHGNTNVLFRSGVQCMTEADLADRSEERCRGLEARRVHPGNLWTLELPFDSPAEFILDETGRVRRFSPRGCCPRC